MAVATGGLIRYLSQNGMWQAAVYSTLSNAQADAITINAAIAAGTDVVIGGMILDTSNSPVKAEACSTVTPA
jgi:hypothetical protein